METLNKQKPLFIGLSCLSIGCLIGAFGYPLQKLEIYKQVEKGAFGTSSVKTYVITENDRNYPYGFSKGEAKKFAQIHQSYTLQKILLLTFAGITATTALSIGYETVPLAELEDEIKKIKSEAKKELTLKGIKARFALANKSQQLLFLDEMKALMEEFSSPEQEIQEADEINALYEELATDDDSTQESDTVAAVTQETIDFRQHFPESLDGPSWKAILKAMGEGAGKDEIVKDVLGCNDQTREASLAYVEFLFKSKFIGQGAKS
jgi:hypothetical protein